MKKHFRLLVADNLWDGEGWSVNDFYDQPVILAIPEGATGADILATLKKEGLLRKRFRYDVEDAWPDNFFVYYLTDFQCVLNLRIIHDEDLERERVYKYGIQGRPTEILEIRVKQGKGGIVK